MIRRLIMSLLCAGSLLFPACNNTGKKSNATTGSIKIVSLNGTLSEILVNLGLEKNIAGVDMTSTFPESLTKKPKVGHNRTISAEGVLALQPDLVVGIRKELSPKVQQQLKDAGVRTILFDQEYSVQGTKNLINAVTDSLDADRLKASAMIARLDDEVKQVPDPGQARPKVLFIYARGTGTMMVAGEDTPLEKIIWLAGAENAIKGFKEYKPLTAEALVSAAPDVILLFNSGLSSLGGTDGLLQVQGVAQTPAGRNKRIIEMDGQLLTGFGPRLGSAVAELAQKIKN